MSGSHFIYIPVVMIAGLLLGLILGACVVRGTYDKERENEGERTAARESTGCAGAGHDGGP